MSPSTRAAQRRRRTPRPRPLTLVCSVVGALALLATGLAAGAPASAAPQAPAAATRAASTPSASTPTVQTPVQRATHARTAAAALAALPDLGPDVTVFDPSMPQADIQAAADAVYAQQVDAEMGTTRKALLFLPGTYGSIENPLIVKVGYDTEVAGLGQSPGDVVINGHVDVYNRCLAPDNCLALVNFWRSLANLTVNVTGESGCRGSGMFWAVSQAAPMRRVQINGNLTLMDYCTAGPQYASGGFIADSRTGSITNGSQQQFLVRDSSIGPWSNAVWNQVFSGVEGAPAQSFPDPPYTTLATTPASRERPYLFVDTVGTWQVFVPDARTDSVGTTWSAETQTPGHAIPLSQFVIAHPGDSVASINAGLRAGKHLLLTPGLYDTASSIAVHRADTVVLGLGLPTLTSVGGAVPLVVDGAGVDVAGLMIDAGPQRSQTLMRVGPVITPRKAGGTEVPIGIQDVFFRVGGPHVGRTTTALKVNADDVVLDDIWVWRADHGTGVGWTTNTSDTGVVVNGGDVTATGLFVEHFQKNNVVWNGEGGRTVFFQNELPYDAPDQASWSHGSTLGWAAYKVAPTVRTHELWGGGSYIYTNVDPSLHASRGFEVPVTPGVRLHDLLTVQLGAGTLDHVVNDVGAPVDGSAVGVPSYVASYP